MDEQDNKRLEAMGDFDANPDVRITTGRVLSARFPVGRTVYRLFLPRVRPLPLWMQTRYSHALYLSLIIY